MKFTRLLVITMLLAPAALAQDVLRVGAVRALSATTATVPVFLRDVAGTPLSVNAGAGKRIQALAFKVTVSPAISVASISFERAGALQSLTPLYERSVDVTEGLAYLASFSESAAPIPFILNAAIPGTRIGTLVVTLQSGQAADTKINLLIDSSAILSNEAGTITESVVNRKLTVASGSVTIGGTTTATTLGSNLNPSIFGNSVTFTATVTSATSATVGGTVVFLDGAQIIGSANVVAGTATFTTSSLGNGSHSMTARFEGDSAHLPSTSSVLTQIVNINPVAPTGLVATATSANAVGVAWNATEYTNQFEVRRSSNNSAFVTIATVTGTSYNDTTVSPDTTYLYAVRGVHPGGVSAESAKDAATTVIFSDSPLAAGGLAKLVHLTQLRTAVNAYRASVGLAPVTFTDSAVNGLQVRGVHLNELRTGLQDARTALGLGALALTDPTLTPLVTKVKAAHWEQLRNAVK